MKRSAMEFGYIEERNASLSFAKTMREELFLKIDQSFSNYLRFQSFSFFNSVRLNISKIEKIT